MFRLMRPRRHARRGVALFAVLLCAVLVPAGASAAQGQWHSGFYFNADVGPAGTYYHYSGPNDSLDTHSGGANVDFRFGYALTPHLMLSGDLSGAATQKNPDTTLDGRNVYSSGDLQFSSGMLGVGLTWYFDDNMFAGFTAGVGQVTLQVNNTDWNSNSGFGTQIRVGKEWWVGSEWGLGIVSGLSYVSATTDTNVTVTDSSGNVYAAHFDHVDSTAAFVAFTATFN